MTDVCDELRQLLAELAGDETALDAPDDTPLLRAGVGLDSLRGAVLLTEIKRRAEIRMGELLKATERVAGGERGGRHAKDGSRAITIKQPTLRELGISKAQSSDFQKLAAVPKDEMEKRIEAVEEVARHE